MTLEEANKIYIDWKEYMEIADKLNKVFSIVPESFLPYPLEILEEALNIIAKYYFDSGDKKIANNIQETMGAYLSGYYFSTTDDKVVAKNYKLTGEEILKKMKRDLDFMLENPELLKFKLKNLKEARYSWAKLNSNAPRCYKCGHIANVIRDDAN